VPGQRRRRPVTGIFTLDPVETVPITIIFIGISPEPEGIEKRRARADPAGHFRKILIRVGRKSFSPFSHAMAERSPRNQYFTRKIGFILSNGFPVR
jgi:hypothetical protein